MINIRRLILRAVGAPPLQIAILRAEQAEGEALELAGRVQALHHLAAEEEARADRAEMQRDDARDGLEKSLDREQALTRALTEARGEIEALTADASRIADVTIDTLTAGEAVTDAITALTAEHERLKGDFDRVSRSWGESIKAREILEARLRAEEGRTATLRAEIASLRRDAVEPAPSSVVRGSR